MSILSKLFLYAICLALTSTAYAEPINHIEYNAKNDLLTIQVSDVYLDDVLNQLAEKVNFKVSLDGEDLHRKVTFTISSDSKKAIQQLVQPNNVILSQADTEPHKVTGVFLLPIGEQSREARIRANMEKPILTDNAEDNTRRMAEYERRIERRILGFGIRKE